VWIDNITFSGFLQMSVSDQEEIAASVRKESHGALLDGVVEDALERVRGGWQDRGYFKVQVDGEARSLTTTAAEIHIALFAHVDEHSKYALSQITFRHSNVDIDYLRSLFPIKDGDAFSREKIATGLENLRKAYGAMGYLNYTGVPDTEFDEKKSMISLGVDLDSGKQFFISSISVLGLDDAARQALLRDLPLKVDDVYNTRLWELGLLKHSSMFPTCECRSEQGVHMDEERGTVALTLDFRPCNN
jgi:outer membrane protein insertion porin family